MLASDIFAKAVAYLSQSPEESEDLAQFTPHWLDLLVMEALPYENTRRRYLADPLLPELDTAPTITGLDTDIPFGDEICRVALPYGLASQFFIDDAEDYRAQDFRARFIAALQDSQRIRSESVVDLYA